MGRKKTIYKRYLIGLDKTQSNTIESMAILTGMTYSEVVSYLITKFQLSDTPYKP